MRRTGPVVFALVATSGLAAGCGSRSVVVGGATNVGGAGVSSGLPAFVACMHTHGEPKMPDPTIEGNGLHLAATRGSGFDASSPQFTTASNACRHLLPRLR